MALLTCSECKGQVSSTAAGLLWAAAIAVICCVIYDYNFAGTVGGFSFYGFGPESQFYYSILAGGRFTELKWLIIGLAAAAVLTVIGAVIFVAGFCKRIKVTNARVIIKRSFKPTAGLIWERVEFGQRRAIRRLW
ncbi:MAG: hypothetical protein K2J77_00625 [Oscillospiraceae bacterium]|nr:hypothetical protein [Oscillospiraceae bacterium]